MGEGTWKTKDKVVRMASISNEVRALYKSFWEETYKVVRMASIRNGVGAFFKSFWEDNIQGVMDGFYQECGKGTLYIFF